MTFKQITDSFNKRFYDLSSCLYDNQYKFNHFDPDSDSLDTRREYAAILCESYRGLVDLTSEIDIFRRFASKDSEKDSLFKLGCVIDDFCDKWFDFVADVHSMYHWDY